MDTSVEWKIADWWNRWCLERWKGKPTRGRYISIFPASIIISSWRQPFGGDGYEWM